MNETQSQILLTNYLKSIGLDLNDENYRETPNRIVRMHKEMMFGMTTEAKIEITKILSKKFPCISSDMVVFSNIPVTSLCPHHLLPVCLKIWVAYIPNGKEVIGLSKIPRLVKLLCKKPVLQEELPGEIADCLVNNTSNLGVFVIVKGRHGCMWDRGVEAKVPVLNSTVRGAFKHESTRNEALKLMEWGSK